MKHYKTIQVPACEQMFDSHLTCDLCGKASPKEDNWSTERFGLEELVISLRRGKNYPEGGGSRTELEFHICPECFGSKLVLWLESQGAKGTEAEWDW